MSSEIRQILVHLDASSRSSVRLNVARRLAQQHGAAVAALYAVMPTVIATPYISQASAAFGANLTAYDEQRRNRAKAAFDATMKDPGGPASWNELTEFSVTYEFSRQALYTDLLVLGQHDPADTEAANVPADFAESVMAASGKPALIVPWSGARHSVGGTVVIAWKETPEAARAVVAAMPVLQAARHVHVVSWSSPISDVGGSLSLETYLRAHRVAAVWHRHGDEPPHLGELLLSTAFDLDADLLVMGCYGHSRAREWVLGGMSRTILQSMTLPVLMAH